MKQLPLNDLHERFGAKFGEFAGWNMPLFYKPGIMAEHRHTRAQAGLFDISHMVHVEIEGPRAADFISHLCPYVASEQQSGHARYTFFMNEAGGLIDDLIVTRLGPQRYLVVCNAGCADKDISHMRAHAGAFGVSVTPLERVFLALQGPQAEAVLAAAGHDFSNLAFLQALEPRAGWFVSRSGYTGEDGFEIAMSPAEAVEFSERLVANERVMLVGLGARDSLRLEAALPLYGQDLGEDISPAECGILWAIPEPLRREGTFIGAEALRQTLESGPRRKRIGIRPQGAQPVRSHALIHDASGAVVGEITSGGFGPTVNGPVAMALINRSATAPLEADVRGRRVALGIVPLPFVPRNYKR